MYISSINSFLPGYCQFQIIYRVLWRDLHILFIRTRTTESHHLTERLSLRTEKITAVLFTCLFLNIPFHLYVTQIKCANNKHQQEIDYRRETRVLHLWACHKPSRLVCAIRKSCMEHMLQFGDCSCFSHLKSSTLSKRF